METGVHNSVIQRVSMHLQLGWTGVALGALFWIWRRTRKRIATEREKNRRAKPRPSNDLTESESVLVSSTHQVELHLRLWTAPRPRGVVLAIHNFTWHSACFTELAKALTQRSFNVLAPDLQGHGLSGTLEKTRGDVRRYEQLIADIEKILEYVRREFVDLPVFLLGVGFGATLALLVSIKSDCSLDGLILVGPYVLPYLDPHPPSSITPMLAALEKLMPDLRIAEAEPTKAVLERGMDASMLHPPTLRMFVQAQKALLVLRKRLTVLKYPFMTLHAGKDPRAAPQHSRELFARAKSQDKRLMIYENMESCLFGELPEHRSQVFTDILAWLDSKTQSSESNASPTGKPMGPRDSTVKPTKAGRRRLFARRAKKSPA